MRVSPPVLRYVRTQQGRSITDVARAAGVSRQFISMIEHGEKRPSRRVFGAIVELLDVDPAVLMAHPEATASPAAA